MKPFSLSKRYYSGPKSDHFDGERFFNPWNSKLPKSSDVFRWKMSSIPKRWPRQFTKTLNDIPPPRIEDDRLRISFVGHSTLLIQTEGLNIITDPIWSKRASPFKWFGPKRFYKPGIQFDNLPKIDLILISHNHYDHLDLHTIHRIWSRDRSQIITPLGNDTIIQTRYPDIPVITLDWHESFSCNDDFHIHLEAAQHWSARGILDRNKALWGAFVIQTKSGNIYFAGDTGYGDGWTFRQSKEKFGAFRFAMLPIGAYQPKWFMHYAHMSPEEAVYAYQDLGQPFTAAIHYQTFQLGDEGFNEPQMTLQKSLQASHLNLDRFRCLSIGESWFIPR